MIPHSFQRALAAKQETKTWRQLSSQQQTLLDFTSNDYLNLSQHPLVIQAAIEAITVQGTSSTGARLLSGNSAAHEALEVDLAHLKNQEAALIFNTGFQANLTILGTILNAQHHNALPIVFSDRLNHASMHQGCQLAGVRQYRYQHLDYDHLQHLIKKYAKPGHPHFILTESIFSMDGDAADLATLCDLAESIQAYIYVDEAHATGVVGQNGCGLTSAYAERLFAVMGTFSKALGGFGAYVTGSQTLKDFLINFAPGFIYSTALPPATIAANHQALKLLPILSHERQHLEELSAYARCNLARLGFNTGHSTTHIIPIILDDIEHTQRLYQHLLDHNIRVSCIRPPTVPPHSSRLRLALQAHHQKDNIDKLCEVLTKQSIA
ncbi:aminotransferase class I/II-fold pyridoxal phosphate-dependent enzyme [Candidatus Odyssella thessalonicensis]|uniref:aminotransferase class I/II-fold pyridoxal phosphate-dependent enzyme n=1 Tax=Candidatus Odyssella thessalonicensis TaxID=84647 RepID=UPI000225C21C|nr:8-amino-7-oxononanoate synthase [Candidatus Odyssella thessalonicensis]